MNFCSHSFRGTGDITANSDGKNVFQRTRAVEMSIEVKWRESLREVLTLEYSAFYLSLELSYSLDDISFFWWYLDFIFWYKIRMIYRELSYLHSGSLIILLPFVIEGIKVILDESNGYIIPYFHIFVSYLERYGWNIECIPLWILEYLDDIVFRYRDDIPWSISLVSFEFKIYLLPNW